MTKILKFNLYLHVHVFYEMSYEHVGQWQRKTCFGTFFSLVLEMSWASVGAYNVQMID